MTNEQFDQIMGLLEKIQKEQAETNERLRRLEEDKLSREEAHAVVDTLQEIAVTSDQYVEDKADAIYEMLKSLIHGSENRIVDRITGMEIRFDSLEDRFDNVEDQFYKTQDLLEKRFNAMTQVQKEVLKAVNASNELLQTLVQKDQEQDRAIGSLLQFKTAQEKFNKKVEERLNKIEKKLAGGE